MDLTLRAEEPSDAGRIDDVVRAAFAGLPWSDGGEARMVRALRNSNAYVASLTLVAETARTVVGHIMLTRTTIGAGCPSLAVAPLSVQPDKHRQGVGTALVQEALRRARCAGYGSVTVLGHPDYYARFGFVPMRDHGIETNGDVAPSSCMVLALMPGGLDGVSGRVRYAPAFFDH